MSVVDELIHIEGDGTISFGNYLLDTKTKLDNVEYNGDIYKVKTFKEITKLEKNGMFVYESVPGTTVHNLSISDNKVELKVEGADDPQITLELEPETENYKKLTEGEAWLRAEVQHFSVKNAAMRHLNGWDSVRAADSGTRLWRLL